ncbi:MAG: secretin N-terminal domain-containing protein [Bacteroidota bacterium]
MSRLRGVGRVGSVVLLALVLAGPASGQVVDIDRANLPPAALSRVSSVNVRSADLRDVFRAVASDAGLNLVVDDRIERRVTVGLDDLSAIDAVVFLAEEHGLSVVQTGSVFRVRLPEPLPPGPLRISATAGDRITADLDGAPVEAVARRLTEVTGINVTLAPGTRGPVSAFVQDVPFPTALVALFESNGFVVRERDGLTLVEPGFAAQDSTGVRGPATSFGVEVGDDGLFALDLRGADVAQAVREIGRRSTSGSVVTYTLPQGRRVTVRASGLTLAEALQAVLRGTGASFRQEGSILVVGTREQDGIEATRLLPLGYVRVADVFERIPPAVSEGLVVQPVPEQNAVLVTGPNDRIAGVEAFLAAVDTPAPQIFIEALVVDYLDTDVFEAGLTLGRGLVGTDEEGERLPTGYVLNSDGSVVYAGDGDDATDIVDGITDLLGVQNLGRLPDDFYFRLRLLAEEGKVEVRSRPQIATLNGNTASIAVGTTQYFVLNTTTPIVGGNQAFQQVSQQFETIEANVSLTITPFVGPGGEITATIVPEFSQPVGTFTVDDEGRITSGPTISTRIVESTVRLRDGETIVLGGLVEDRDVVTDRKIPILGDIPLLGRLFRTRVRDRERSELVIYLTPTVFYGDGRDASRWRGVVDRQNLQGEGDIDRDAPVLPEAGTSEAGTSEAPGTAAPEAVDGGQR